MTDTERFVLDVIGYGMVEAAATARQISPEYFGDTGIGLLLPNLKFLPRIRDSKANHDYKFSDATLQRTIGSSRPNFRYFIEADCFGYLRAPKSIGERVKRALLAHGFSEEGFSLTYPQRSYFVLHYSVEALELFMTGAVGPGVPDKPCARHTGLYFNTENSGLVDEVNRSVDGIYAITHHKAKENPPQNALPKRQASKSTLTIWKGK
jgi:hypothetical protein